MFRKSYLIISHSDDFEHANLSESCSDENDNLLSDGSESKDNDDEILIAVRNWWQISTNQPNVASQRFSLVANPDCSFTLTDCYDVLTYFELFFDIDIIATETNGYAFNIQDHHWTNGFQLL